VSQAWPQQAAEEAVPEERPLSAAPQAQGKLAQRAAELPVWQDAELERAAQRQVQERVVWLRQEPVAELAERPVRAVSQQQQAEARERPASGEPPWRRLPSPLCRPRLPLRWRHPARLGLESCGAPFRRRPPG
jgi:hypothetical protein